MCQALTWVLLTMQVSSGTSVKHPMGQQPCFCESVQRPSDLQIWSKRLFLILPSKQRKGFRFNWDHAEKDTRVRRVAWKVIAPPDARGCSAHQTSADPRVSVLPSLKHQVGGLQLQSYS